MRNNLGGNVERINKSEWSCAGPKEGAGHTWTTS